MKKTLISFAVFLLILIGLLVFCVKVIFYAPDIKTHVIELYAGESDTVNIDDQYFYLQNNRLYKYLDNGSSEFLYDFSDSPYHVYMKAYEKNIWVCVHSELGKDEQLFVFNEQGKLIQDYSVPDSDEDDIQNFVVSGKSIYCVGIFEILSFSMNDDEISKNVLDYQMAGENDDEVISKSEDENIICFKIFNKFPESTAYSLYNKESGEWISTSGVLNRAFHYENNILFYLTYAAGKSPGSSELGFICNSLSDTAKAEISCDETDNSLIPPDPVLYYDQNKMIALAFKNRSGNTPSGSFDSMGGHKHDVLCVFDISKRELQAKYKTRKHERVIYADFEKAITYYDGEYYFRSLDDWSITSEIPAEEIKEGGDYTFDSCGDYIFVFNTETGELLNRISVK